MAESEAEPYMQIIQKEEIACYCAFIFLFPYVIFVFVHMYTFCMDPTLSFIKTIGLSNRGEWLFYVLRVFWVNWQQMLFLEESKLWLLVQECAGEWWREQEDLGCDREGLMSGRLIKEWREEETEGVLQNSGNWRSREPVCSSLDNSIHPSIYYIPFIPDWVHWKNRTDRETQRTFSVMIGILLKNGNWSNSVYLRHCSDNSDIILPHNPPPSCTASWSRHMFCTQWVSSLIPILSVSVTLPLCFWVRHFTLLYLLVVVWRPGDWMATSVSLAAVATM